MSSTVGSSPRGSEANGTTAAARFSIEPMPDLIDRRVGVGAAGEGHDRIAGQAESHQIIAADVGFVERIARADASGDQDDGCQSPLVQGGGVIESSAKNGRGAAVVLGGAEDRDGIGAGGFIAGGVDGHRDHYRRPSERDQNDRKDNSANGTPSGPEWHATRYSGACQQLLEQIERPRIIGLPEPEDRLAPQLGITILFGDPDQGGDAFVPGAL